jgi:hypothetical protein
MLICYKPSLSLLAACDAAGVVGVYRFDSSNPLQELKLDVTISHSSASFSTSRPTNLGWTGAAFHPKQTNQVPTRPSHLSLSLSQCACMRCGVVGIV